jgi:rubrerythrin
LKYELQTRERGAEFKADADWETVERSTRLEPMRRLRKDMTALSPAREYRVVEVVPDAADPATPTIEEKHAAELEELADAEKRWTARYKRAATKLKKIRARKRRLERLYAPKDEP